MDKGDQKHLSFNLKFFSEHLKADEVINYTATQFPDTISEVEVTTLKSSSSAFWKTSKIIEKFKKKQDGLDRLYAVLEATGHSELVLKTLNPKRFAKANAPTTESSDGSLHKEHKDSSMVGRQDVPPRHRISDAPLLPARQKTSLEKRALGKSPEDTVPKFEVVKPTTQNKSTRADKVQDPVTTSQRKLKYSDPSKGLPQTRLPLPPISPRNLTTLDVDTEVKGEKVTQVPRDNMKPQRDEVAEGTQESVTMKTQASRHDKEEASVLGAHRITTGGQEGKPSAADDHQRKHLDESSVDAEDQNTQDIQQIAATTPDEKQKTRDTIYDDEATGPVTTFKDQQSQFIQGLFGEMMAQMIEHRKQLLKAQDEKFAAQDEKFAALSKDMKDLGYRLDAFKDTIAEKMDLFEHRLITLEKGLKEVIDEKTAPLKEELETLKQLFISLEDSVQQLQQSQDILQGFSDFRDKLFKILEKDISKIRGDIDELRTDFTTLKRDTNVKLSEMIVHNGSENQQKHDVIRSFADPVLEDDVRRIAQKIKGIRQELSKLLGVQMYLTEIEKGSMDDEGQAEAVLTSWMLGKAGKGEHPTWGELTDAVFKINSEIATDVDTLRNN